jgi:hypothetical protein
MYSGNITRARCAGTAPAHRCHGFISTNAEVKVSGRCKCVGPSIAIACDDMPPPLRPCYQTALQELGLHCAIASGGHG